MELGLVVLVVLECVYGVWKDLSGYLISYGVAVIILFEGGIPGRENRSREEEEWFWSCVAALKGVRRIEECCCFRGEWFCVFQRFLELERSARFVSFLGSLCVFSHDIMSDLSIYI